MFSSDPPKVDPTEVEEFQLPGLGESEVASPPVCWELAAWDSGDPEGGSRLAGESGVRAEAILSEAREKAQEIERLAYEEGFAQGLKDGQEVGRRGLEEVVHRFLKIVNALEEEREQLLLEREGWLVELVLLVCRKLLTRELSLQPEAIHGIIAEGFRQVAHLEGLRVVVSPPDYEILTQENPRSWPLGVELAPDSALTPGGFRLETALGEVDGSLESRWAAVEETVQKALEKRYAPPSTP